MPSSESKDYPKAKKVNGRFVLPWGGSLPSTLAASRWFMMSPNNSSLPGGRLKDFFQYDAKVNVNFTGWKLCPIKYFSFFSSILWNLFLILFSRIIRPFPSCLLSLFQNESWCTCNHSNENEFDLHLNELVSKKFSFPYERLCTRLVLKQR